MSRYYDHAMATECVVPENIHTPPHRRFFVLHPHTPQEIPVKLHTVLLIVWLLNAPSP